MRRLGRALLIVSQLVPWLAMAACGTTSTGLDVGYPAESSHRAMLASVSPRRVQLAPVADRRTDLARIGVKPASGEPLVPTRPVGEILREALTVELANNGHVVVADKPDLVLAAEVDEFWLDAVPGYKKVQYIGRVAISVTVSDGRTGAPLVTRHYAGIKRWEGDAQPENAARDVMNMALVRTMRDLATDPELVSAFSRGATADRAELSPAAAQPAHAGSMLRDVPG